MSKSDNYEPRVGYMCLVDFEHELGFAADGNRVHPSIEDIKSARKCAEECGIVEVEVRFRRIVQEPADIAERLAALAEPTAPR